MISIGDTGKSRV